MNIYLRYATGISWRLTLLTLRYEPWMNYMRLAFAWLELLWAAAMLVFTLRRFGKSLLAPTRKNIALLAAGWAAFALLHVSLKPDPLSWMANVAFLLLDWVKLALLTLLLIHTFRLLRGRKPPVT